jgi:hypothetical protein
MCTEATVLESELRLRVQRRVEDGRLPVLLVSHLDACHVIWQRECAHRAAHVNRAKPNVEGMKQDLVA